LREAERRILDVEELGQLVNRQIIPYVNRLSDLLFMLARYEDRDLPDELITGQKINE
jgi:cob(I)alamin adenosyltransferase